MSKAGFKINFSRGIFLEFLFYLLIFGVSLAMRLWELGDQAIHHDESLHAFYSYMNSLGNFYRHHPITHGVFLMHITGGSFFVFGDSDFIARLPEAIFGSVLVLLPIGLRPWLGRGGSIAAALGLAFSPSLLYFSRFARNDIFMAVFALGIAISLWRYIRSRRPVWLYVLALLLALAFTTKETAYIIFATFAMFLFAVTLPDTLKFFRRRDYGIRKSNGAVGVNAPTHFTVGTLWRYTGKWSRFTRRLSPSSSLLWFMAIVGTPLFMSGFSVFQNLFGVLLAAPDGTLGVPTGAPQQGVGFALAAALVGIALGGSFLATILSFRRDWIIGWVLFYFVFALIFTNFFTYPDGAATGVWQSLGYWLAQQDVARGGQRWWYYLMLSGVYEFLPFAGFLLGVVGYTVREAWRAAKQPYGISGKARYFLQKGDMFAKFCILWAVATFLAYTVAGEKFPWLMVNMVVPMIILSAKLLSDLAHRILSNFKASEESSTKWRSGLRYGAGAAFGLTMVLVIGVLFTFTVRASVFASYKYRDVPQELMIYTQTSRETHLLARRIYTLGDSTESGYDTAISIGEELSWPWRWYLRRYNAVRYDAKYQDSSKPDDAKYAVHIVRPMHMRYFEGEIADDYTEPESVVLRASFPEARYRCGMGEPLPPEVAGARWCPEGALSLGDVLGGILRPERLRGAADYWLYRRLDGDELNESLFINFDSVVYFDREAVTESSSREGLP